MASDLYPARTDAELEELAEELNHKYFTDLGRPLTLPIPVEDMAEHFLGYTIDITNQGLFSDPDLLGGIDFEQDLILVNASIEDHDGRYAFTVAHEIGHHALHRDVFMNSRAFNENEILCRDTTEKSQIEIEADRFAAALLMPPQAIHDGLKALSSKPRVSSIGQARGLASELIKSASFNNVSNSAMINRLIDLKVVPEFVGYQTGRGRQGRGRPSLSMLFRRALAKLGI